MAVADVDVIVVGAGVVGLWALSGFYIVQPSERGVVLTFGSYSRIAGSGPNYHLPFPIEKVEKVSVTSLRRTDVGGQKDGDSPAESLMLTGDEQIIDLDFSITWRVSDPRAYLFATRSPDEAVKTLRVLDAVARAAAIFANESRILLPNNFLDKGG